MDSESTPMHGNRPTETKASSRWMPLLAVACASLAWGGEVDPERHGPQFQGWGTSLAWWAKKIRYMNFVKTSEVQLRTASFRRNASLTTKNIL